MSNYEVNPMRYDRQNEDGNAMRFLIEDYAIVDEIEKSNKALTFQQSIFRYAAEDMPKSYFGIADEGNLDSPLIVTAATRDQGKLTEVHTVSVAVDDESSPLHLKYFTIAIDGTGKDAAYTYYTDPTDTPTPLSRDQCRSIVATLARDGTSSANENSGNYGLGAFPPEAIIDLLHDRSNDSPDADSLTIAQIETRNPADDTKTIWTARTHNHDSSWQLTTEEMDGTKLRVTVHDNHASIATLEGDENRATRVHRVEAADLTPAQIARIQTAREALRKS